MHYTTNYHFLKPEHGEHAYVENWNNNSDSLDSLLYKHKLNISAVYNPASTYTVGQYVTYEDVLYKCISNVIDPEAFDSDKWQQCQIVDEIGKSGYIELTTAQYDQLPEDVKNNGTVYYLVDGGLGLNNYITAFVYSSQEREVGVWATGKPLYQMTLMGEFSNTSEEPYTEIILDSESVEDTLHAEDIFITEGSYLDASVVNSDSEANVSIDNDRNIVIRIKGIVADAIKYAVTIQYTKTTDVPGSGIVNQDALPSVHYSLAEHVVGTWIDGATLYERSYYVQGVTDSAVTVDNQITGQTINLVDVQQSYHVLGGSYHDCWGNDTISSGMFLRVILGPTSLAVNFEGYRTDYFGDDGVDAYITIRYTKVESE